MTNTHGGPRSGAGPKTKASKGEQKYKQLSITLPPELWKAINAKRRPDETISGLIQRMLLGGLK